MTDSTLQINGVFSLDFITPAISFDRVLEGWVKTSDIIETIGTFNLGVAAFEAPSNLFATAIDFESLWGSISQIIQAERIAEIFQQIGVSALDASNLFSSVDLPFLPHVADAMITSQLCLPTPHNSAYTQTATGLSEREIEDAVRMALSCSNSNKPVIIILAGRDVIIRDLIDGDKTTTIISSPTGDDSTGT